MSPPPRVLLLDSCSYFRLARSIHPLLAETFGPPPPYSLLRIPMQTGHPFRLISDTCSDSDRTPIPIDIGHLERRDSDAG